MSARDSWKWIPDPVTKETRRFELCSRCGARTSPSYGKPRECSDCRDLVKYARRDEVVRMSEDGYSNAQIARDLGINPKTVARWLRKAERVAA